jgi:tRNA acetyltransferase TAN1
MHKRDGDPGPVEIVQNMMSSAASTRKHMSRFIFDVIGIYLSLFSLSLVFQGINSYLLCSYFLAYRLPSWLYFRFILRVCPAEVVCYASEEEITRAISPLVEKYFPKESPSGHKVTCYLMLCCLVKEHRAKYWEYSTGMLQAYILSCISSYIVFLYLNWCWALSLIGKYDQITLV